MLACRRRRVNRFSAKCQGCRQDGIIASRASNIFFDISTKVWWPTPGSLAEQINIQRRREYELRVAISLRENLESQKPAGLLWGSGGRKTKGDNLWGCSGLCGLEWFYPLEGADNLWLGCLFPSKYLYLKRLSALLLGPLYSTHSPQQEAKAVNRHSFV